MIVTNVLLGMYHATLCDPDFVVQCSTPFHRQQDQLMKPDETCIGSHQPIWMLDDARASAPNLEREMPQTTVRPFQMPRVPAANT